MTEEKRQIVHYRMARASETLEEAKLLFDQDHLIGAMNRVYSAMFYGAVALLVTKDLSSSRHSGVIALLNEHLSDPGHSPRTSLGPWPLLSTSVPEATTRTTRF
jgi:uncharacterized protein (UPF0332 family)